MRCTSSGLDALITMLRFLVFSSASKEDHVADCIRQQVKDSQSRDAQQFWQLADKYWDNKDLEAMLDIKDSYWQSLESVFNFESRWEGLVRGQALPDLIEFTLVGDCWDCISQEATLVYQAYQFKAWCNGVTLQTIFDANTWSIDDNDIERSLKDGDLNLSLPSCSKCSKKFESIGRYVTKPMPPRIIINAGSFALDGDLQPTSISMRAYTVDQGADRHEFQWLATVAVKEETETVPAGYGFFHKSHSVDGDIWQFDPMPAKDYKPSDATVTNIHSISPE